MEVRNEKGNGNEEIVAPHDHDVLCGRGGNKLFQGENRMLSSLRMIQIIVNDIRPSLNSTGQM